MYVLMWPIADMVGTKVILQIVWTAMQLDRGLPITLLSKVPSYQVPWNE